MRLPIPKETQNLLMRVCLEEELAPFVNAEGLNIVAHQEAQDKINELIKSISGSVVVESAADEITFVDFI